MYSDLPCLDRVDLHLSMIIALPSARFGVRDVKFRALLVFARRGREMDELGDASFGCKGAGGSTPSLPPGRLDAPALWAECGRRRNHRGTPSARLRCAEGRA